MTFRELEELTKGKVLPMLGENEDGEAVLIEKGCQDGQRFFKLTTAQHNDWCRVELVWEGGNIEEMYEK